MKTNHQNETKSTEPPTQTITRRSFIKRTASSALVAILAVRAFQTEALAADSASDSKLPKYMEFETTELFEGTFSTKEEAEKALAAAEKAKKLINLEYKDYIANAEALTPPTKISGPTGSISKTTWNLKWYVKLPSGKYKFQINKPKK